MQLNIGLLVARARIIRESHFKTIINTSDIARERQLPIEIEWIANMTLE